MAVLTRLLDAVAAASLLVGAGLMAVPYAEALRHE